VKDFDVFDIKEKWFKEAAPQNYVSGSTEGVPARTPSIVIDKTNDALYVCGYADSTIYNTGWKKYVTDGGGGGDYDYEFVMDVDGSGDLTVTPDPSEITLSVGDTVKVTLGSDLVAGLSQAGATLTKTVLDGTAQRAEDYIVATFDDQVFLIPDTVYVNFEAIGSFTEGVSLNSILSNKNTESTPNTGGLNFGFALSANHTITVDYNNGNVVALEGGQTINGSFDTATITLSQAIQDVLVAGGNTIDKTSATVNASYGSASFYTTIPQGSEPDTSVSGAHFKVDGIAHGNDGTYTLDLYVGLNGGTYACGYNFGT